MVYTYHLYESTFSSQQSLRVSMCPETKMFENHCSKKRIYQKYLLVLEHTHTHHRNNFRDLIYGLNN